MSVDLLTIWIYKEDIPRKRKVSSKTERSAMMKPRRVCLSGGGMVTGPLAALVSGQENFTNIRIIYRSWVTSPRNFDISFRTTDLMDMALSHRRPVSNAAPGAPTDLPPPHPAHCYRCHRQCHRLCRYSILMGTLVREQVASGSGATAPWVVLGTGPCPTTGRGTGTGGPGVVGTPGCCPVVTGPERCRATENVSCLNYMSHLNSRRHMTSIFNVVYQVSQVQRYKMAEIDSCS